MGLKQPRFIKEGWEILNPVTRQWELKPDAPEWAKKEFEEFYKMVNAEPDENGIITQY